MPIFRLFCFTCFFVLGLAFSPSLYAERFQESFPRSEEIRDMEKQINQLLEKEKFSEVFTLARKNTDQIRAKYGPDHLEYGRALGLTAKTYMKFGEYAQQSASEMLHHQSMARSLSEQSIDILKKTLPYDHPDLFALVGVLLISTHSTKGKPQCEKLLEDFKQHYKKDHDLRFLQQACS